MKTISATVLLIIALAALASAQPRYRVTDLGVFQNGGLTSFATAINNRSQIVGYAWYNAGPENFGVHAFLYSNGQMQDLGTIGQGYQGVRISGASDINNHGQIVGDTTTTPSDIYFINPFLWTAGHMVNIGAFQFGLMGGSATGINDRGIVVGGATGYTRTNEDASHAFIYNGGGPIQDLGFGDYSGATSINNRDEITVIVTTGDFAVYRSFLYRNGQRQPLPGLGGNIGYATAINDLSVVAGYSTLPGESVSHAFVYANGKIRDLDPKSPNSSFAFGINLFGIVVGSYNTQQLQDWHDGLAFLWRPGDTQIRNLNDQIDPRSGWILSSATDINDEGQIVGDGLHNGLRRAFLLTPIYFDRR